MSKEEKAAKKVERVAARERLEERRKHMTRQERFNSRTLGNRLFPERFGGAPESEVATFKDSFFFIHRLTATHLDDLELTPDMQVEVIRGQDKSRITATRVAAGAVIAGPLGAIIGGVAKKQGKGEGILTIQGSAGYALIEFKGEHEMGAREFAAAVSTQIAQLPD